MDLPEHELESHDDRVAVTRSRALLRNYFKVDQFTLKHIRHDGKWSEEMERLLLHRPDGACAMVHHTGRNSCLFVRQFRVGARAKEEGWLTELAAGLVDPGESPEEACRREIEEELGYRPREITWLSTFFTSPAIISERVHLYYIQVTDADKVNDGGGLHTEHEDLQVLEVPVTELDSHFAKYPPRDSKTLIGLLMFKELQRPNFNRR